QIDGLNDHAALAEAALRHLLVDPRLLHRVQAARRLAVIQRRKAFHRRDAMTCRGRGRSDAGTDLSSVHEYRARSTLRKATAEPWPAKANLISKNVEQ